jgi:hypothetical protein
MVKRTLIWLLPALLAPLYAPSARADNFGRVYYDGKNDQLVVTMIYRGTNPNHNFSLKWGACHAGQSGGAQEVTVEVLDDQFQDRAQQNFKTTKNFSLEGLPCRPAKVTLRTAPRFFYTLTIPG